MDNRIPGRPVAGHHGTAAGGTSEPPAPARGAQPAAGVRAQTLAWQGLANRIVRGLLRTPLVCHVVGNRLITVYVVGRKSGRRYAVPVAYTRHDGTLLIGTPFGWGRNLRTGQRVDIRIKGKRRPADVQVATDAAGVVELYAVMARDNHSLPSSTTSASTRPATRTRPTCTWPGPQAPEPSAYRCTDQPILR